MQVKAFSPLKIFLVLLAGLVSSTFLSAAVTMAAGAREFETPPCYDITGTTQAVLVGGVNNGGIMDFDDAGVPAPQQACVRMKADAVTPDHLEGWVWNSNLGWVSLYCPGGAGAKNLDALCGSVNYHVDFATSGGTAPNFTTVTMSGQAWGDNTGWIDFGKFAALNWMSPTPSTSNRGLIEASNPDASRYTWSDAEGWMDWTSVWFHWEDTDPPIPDPNITKYVSVCSQNDTIPPVTDGVLKADLAAYGNPQVFDYDSANNKIWVIVYAAGPYKLLQVNPGTGAVENSFNITTNNVFTGVGPISLSSATKIMYDSSHNALWFSGKEGAVYGDLWRFDIGTSTFTEVYRTAAMNDVNPVALDTNHNILFYSVRYFGTIYALNTNTNLTVTNLATTSGGFQDMVYDKTNDILYGEYSAASMRVGRFRYSAGSINYFGGVDLTSSSLALSSTQNLVMALDSSSGDLWGMHDSVSPVATRVLRKATGTVDSYVPVAATKPSANAYLAYDSSRNGVWVGSLTGGADAFDFYRASDGALLGQFSLPTTVSGAQSVTFDTTSKLPWVLDNNGKALYRLTPNTMDAGGPAAPKCNCNLDGTCPALTDPTKIPNADGSQKYDIKIPFVDGGVKQPDTVIDECPTTSVNMYTPSPSGKTYCAKLALTWEDDVDFDQTTAQSQYLNPVSTKPGHGPEFNASPFGPGAVTKPLGFKLDGTQDFHFVPAETLWGANIRSVAPTSEMNSFEGMSNEKFYYPEASSAVLGGYDPTLTNQNGLKLKELKLLFFAYGVSGGPGRCIYGTVNAGNCDMTNYMNASGSVISFNPLVGTVSFAYKFGGKMLNFINVTDPNSPLNFIFSNVVKAPTPPVETELHYGLQNNFDEGTGNYSLKRVAALADPIASALSMIVLPDTVAGDVPGMGKLFASAPGEILDANSGPYLYTRIIQDQPGSVPPQIVYFGPKLPRIKAGLLLNPVAKVQGNVYVTDFGQKAAGVSLHSLGNVSSNLRRTVIAQNVAKYLNGFSTTTASGSQTVGTVDPATVLSTLVNDDKKTVYYLRDGNLRIKCAGADAGTCTFAKNTTFIVENGNIFVDSNITTTGNAQVGLIALRNLVGNVQNQGLLYVGNKVTWLQNVQIYLDRVMVSYNQADLFTNYDISGFPMLMADDYDRPNIFTNQLVMEGTLSSMNGIGNAAQAAPTDENGSVVSPAGTYCASYRVAAFATTTLTGICRAKEIDLNYMRYYGPGLEICSASLGGLAKDGVPRDQQLKADAASSFGCDPAWPAYVVDPTKLTVDGGDLVAGAGGGSRSDYFISKGLPDSFANDFPVNFFYKPISKDLGGFEVEQAYN